MFKLIVICVVMLALHFAVKWLEARQDAVEKFQPRPSLWQFMKDSPAQTLVAVLGTVAAFLMLHEYGLLDPIDKESSIVAGSVGYMGSSVADNFVNQFKRMSK